MKKNKKLFKVLKRKWTRPAIFTVITAFVIYLTIANSIFVRKAPSEDLPHFVITRLSDEFDKIEFMHLLLCVQELRKRPALEQELITFVNTPFPAYCPEILKEQLNLMNWAPDAFHTRVHKMFKMLDSYDHITRLEETITFLSQKIKDGVLSSSMSKDVEMLQKEKDSLIKKSFTAEELEFMQNYAGLIQTIRKEQ
jgi:hypothetical protein